MTTRIAPPIANSYWLPGGAIAAGEYPGSLRWHEAREKIASLLDAGITAFVDLTERGELEGYEALLHELAEARGIPVSYTRRPIRDMSVCSTEKMTAILDEVESAVEDGRKVYVHCWGGVGRTGTVVGCWLVQQGHAPDDALAEVGRLFATMTPEKLGRHPEGSPQTEAQRDVVRRWTRRRSHGEA